MSGEDYYSRGISFYNAGNYSSAFAMFNTAAALGHVDAKAYLGEMYTEGKGVAQNYQEAIKWFQKAVDAGSVWGINCLGHMYFNGLGVDRNYQEAVELFKKAADDGYAVAFGNLGLCYEDGRGVPKSLQKALEFYSKAFDMGESIFASDVERVKKKLADSAAAQQNITEAESVYNAACELYNKGEYEQAFSLFSTASDFGHAEAQRYLGLMYFNGLGVVQDYQEAVKWLRKAVKAGSAWSANNVGYMYYNGLGVARNYQEAMKWYQKAADANLGRAHGNLGLCYEDGSGVPVNLQKALEYYTQAVELGESVYAADVERVKKKLADSAAAQKKSEYIQPENAEKKEDKSADTPLSPLDELDAMIGLEGVKRDVRQTINFVKTQKLREKKGLKKVPFSNHMVFTGNPGTGKTSVARILASIFKEIGLLAKGHLVEVSRVDLVAEYQGQTAPKTRKAIESAIGGVLFIDEAYALAGDGFGQEAIDTLLKEMEDHRDDLIVIVAGYTEPMKKFLKSNPGLQSRFNTYIDFPDYSKDELIQIFNGMCRKYDLILTKEASAAAEEYISVMTSAKVENFGNAREVRNFFEKILKKQYVRIAGENSATNNDMKTIIGADVESFVAEGKTFGISPQEELNSLIGLESAKREVQQIVSMAQMQKIRESQGLKTISISRHMVFTGNPGTGKTTVARIIGRLFKEAGILPKGHVVEVSRGDLVAEYIGQTAPKTHEKIAEAYGGILFIDEAYTLVKNNAPTTSSDFGQEAIDTLLKEMEDHRDNLIVIVAGYTEPMQKFLKSNPGLQSRFNKYIHFPDYNEQDLVRIFDGMCEKYGFALTPEAEKAVQEYIAQLVLYKDENFGNARDVRNFFEAILQRQAERVKTLPSTDKKNLLTITEQDVIRYTPPRKKEDRRIGFY